MNFATVVAPVLLASGLASASTAEAKQQSRPPASWACVAEGPAVVRARAFASEKRSAELGRGALVELLDTKQSSSRKWAQVRFVDPASLNTVTGWVEFDHFETSPPDRLPRNEDLLKLLGGKFLEDAIASDAKIARFRVRQSGQDSALVCYIATRFLPNARLQVFERTGEKFSLGPFLEFPLSDMRAGIVQMEVRDLLGDGNECLITHEPFSVPPDSGGVNLVIRQPAGNAFKLLWRAPLEQRNFSSFPSSLVVLAPPERNIGAPGTVTQGAVEFRTRDRLSEPVWKGTIEFHIPDREAPVESLTIDKLCPWTGTGFAPLH